MELKDLLPLLIIIGSVVFSFIGKRKKQKQNQDEIPEKSIWETLLGEDEEPQVRHADQSREEEFEEEWWEKEESVVEVTEKEQVSEPVMYNEMLEDVQPTVYHKQVSPISSKDITCSKPSKHKPDFSSKEAIKKGIIFSEVFNRKKY